MMANSIAVPGSRVRDSGSPHKETSSFIQALGRFAYVVPTWGFMIAVGLIPIGSAIWMSVTDQRLDASEPEFIGLTNYIHSVFTARFLSALFTTAIFLAIGVILQFLFGYLLAICLHRQLRGFQVARTILLIPMMLTPVVVGLVWQFMFNPDLGVIPAIVNVFGNSVNFFAHPWLARGVVILVDTWMHTPFVMLMLVAGMSALPEDTIEAASIDGASWWQKTRYIVLPMLRPVITIILLVRCVNIVRLFDIIVTTTAGGPGTATQSVSMLAYANTFQFYNFGNGAAIAVALAVIMFPVYFFYVRLTRI